MLTSSSEVLSTRIAEAISVCESLQSESTQRAVDEVTACLLDALRSGNKLLFCGNGGSSADAQHLAAEFVGRFRLERDPLPAIALSDNVAALTAIGNDYAYDSVFARSVRGLGAPGDVVIGLSTSGTSRNVIEALAAARELGLSTVAFLGGDAGTPMEEEAEYVIRVAGPSTARIQEGHMLLGHTVVELVEQELFGR